MRNCDDCVSRATCPAKGLMCNDYVKEPERKSYRQLQAENEKMRKALQWWIDVNEGAPNKYNWAKEALDITTNTPQPPQNRLSQ